MIIQKCIRLRSARFRVVCVWFDLQHTQLRADHELQQQVSPLRCRWEIVDECETLCPRLGVDPYDHRSEGSS
jgi:hypothetical protein